MKPPDVRVAVRAGGVTCGTLAIIEVIVGAAAAIAVEDIGGDVSVIVTPSIVSFGTMKLIFPAVVPDWNVTLTGAVEFLGMVTVVHGGGLHGPFVFTNVTVPSGGPISGVDAKVSVTCMSDGYGDDAATWTCGCSSGPTDGGAVIVIGGGAAMVNVNGLVAVPPALSFTCTVN